MSPAGRHGACRGRAQRHPRMTRTSFTPDDLDRHHRVTELACHPGLPMAAATVRSIDPQDDSYSSCIWAVPLDGADPWRMTQGPWLDHSPCWSPGCESLAFVSSRSGSAQVHLLPMRGGEARPCGSFEGGVSELRWNPDGRSLLVSAAVAVDPDRHGGRGEPAKPRTPTSPEVAWKLPYKSDGIGYLLAREIHLFRLDVASGEQRQLTDGNFDVFGFAPSPDGSRIALCRTREGRFAHRTDLWVCDAEGRAMRRSPTPWPPCCNRCGRPMAAGSRSRAPRRRAARATASTWSTSPPGACARSATRTSKLRIRRRCVGATTARACCSCGRSTAAMRCAASRSMAGARCRCCRATGSSAPSTPTAAGSCTASSIRRCPARYGRAGATAGRSAG